MEGDGRRCRATAKGTGEQCRRAAVPGGQVCASHGGSAPQVRAAGQRRLVAAEAQAAVARILGESGGRAVVDPVAELAELAGKLSAALDAIGALVERRGRVGSNGPAGEGIVPEVQIWLSLAGELRMSLAILSRIDLDERRLRVDAATGAQIGRAWQALTDRLAERWQLDEERRREGREEAATVLRLLASGEFIA